MLNSSFRAQKQSSSYTAQKAQARNLWCNLHSSSKDLFTKNSTKIQTLLNSNKENDEFMYDDDIIKNDVEKSYSIIITKTTELPKYKIPSTDKNSTIQSHSYLNHTSKWILTCFSIYSYTSYNFSQFTL